MSNKIVESIKEMHGNNVSGSPLIILRLTLGFTFLTTWASNFTKDLFTEAGYRGLLNFYLGANDQTPYNIVVEQFILPNAQLFVIIQIILELFIALALIFGLFTRLGSIIGVFVSMNLFFLTLGADWPWSYLLMVAGFLVTGLSSAGKWYGIDFWLEKRVNNKFLNFFLF
ncbi:MAG: DoxX family protein [Candidatus Hodarchaeales archaeon]|jgi:NADH dehydrogenase